MSETNEKKPRRKRLTPQQRKLVEARIKNPDATLAELARKADYHDAQGAHKALQSPNVQARMAELMDARPKLTKSALLDKLEEGLEAKDIRLTPSGMQVDLGPDHTARREYLKMAAQWRGDIVTPEQEEGGFSRPALAVIILTERERRGLAPIQGERA